MRRFGLILIVLLVLSCVNISAADHEITPGKVLYHQDFADISDIAFSGIKIGTLSTDNAFINCPGECLSIRMYDRARVYMIMPHTKRANTYTVEFSFSFEPSSSSNGYIALMLTCRGDEPSNISYVLFRADGTVDDFESPAPELSAAIAAGETVNVTVPVENNILHEIHLTVGENTYTLNRDRVLVMSNENFGFAVRNTSVNVHEVYVVDGVGYTEKSGYYTVNSYASDNAPIIPEGGDLSPDTSDSFTVILCVCIGSVVALVIFAIFGKRRK